MRAAIETCSAPQELLPLLFVTLHNVCAPSDLAWSSLLEADGSARMDLKQEQRKMSEVGVKRD